MNLPSTIGGEPPDATFNVSGHILTGNHGLIACTDEDLDATSNGEPTDLLHCLGKQD